MKAQTNALGSKPPYYTREPVSATIKQSGCYPQRPELMNENSMRHIHHESDLDFNDRMMDSPSNKQQIPLLSRKLTINKNSAESSEMVYFNQNEPFSANQVVGQNRSRIDSGISEPVLNEVNHGKHVNVPVQHHKHH